VQAENYDTGGQDVGYHVNSVNGTANGFRADGVDLEVTADSGGGYNLGWTGGGQWFRYTVNAASAGVYTVSLRVSSPGGATGAFHISDASGQNLSGAVNVPATGGWQAWTTVTASVTLPAGQQVLTVNQDGGGWNINYLTFVKAANPLAGVSLRAHANGRYVTAGTAPLIASATAIGISEVFDEIEWAGNVALRAHVNNMYVCAENGGADSLIANRDSVGGWETFVLVHNPDGSVSLRAAVNNMYVTAENAGAAALIANRTAIGPWEEFDLITTN
jgi:hypothetical protein